MQTSAHMTLGGLIITAYAGKVGFDGGLSWLFAGDMLVLCLGPAKNQQEP